MSDEDLRRSGVSDNPLAGMMDMERGRATFAIHGNVLGAAGYVDPNDQDQNADFLGQRGDSLSCSPPAEGFGAIHIGAAWDPRRAPYAGLVGRVLGMLPVPHKLRQGRKIRVDLDLGCLYELHNGHRGAVQAFGKSFGAYEQEPYIALSGDERVGDAEGYDEVMTINGLRWDQIKRVLVYVYIYAGAADWAQAAPQVQVRVPGYKPMVLSLGSAHKHLGLCAIASLENVRNGIRLTNHSEYFAGHVEMDRAFGFGLEWADGQKQPLKNK